MKDSAQIVVCAKSIGEIVKIRTQETVTLYETYEYDMGELRLPEGFEEWTPAGQAHWLSKHCVDCQRIEWDYAGIGTLDEYDVIE